MATSRATTVTVKIKKWENYNPRSDVKKPSWFRVEYQLLEDPDFYGFSHGEFKAWFYVLAQACRKNSGTIRVNYHHAETTAKLSRGDLDGSIEKLESLGIVTATRDEPVTQPERERHAAVTDTNATGRDGTGRNGTERDVCGPIVPVRGRGGEAGKEVRGAVWDSYSEAYVIRHRVEPTRNAKVNSLIATFSKMVPAGEAAEIARYYVLRHNDALYVRGRHPLELLVRDYQRIRADWLDGQQMTGGKAREVERKQDLVDVFGPLIAKAEADEAAKKGGPNGSF